jgi:hypothetical protein
MSVSYIFIAKRLQNKSDIHLLQVLYSLRLQLFRHSVNVTNSPHEISDPFQRFYVLKNSVE